MRRTKIHLSKPFEEVLATLFTLPRTLAEAAKIRISGGAGSVVRQSAKCDAEAREGLRALYEAAHGRQVETQIGFLAIAPPVAGFLKEEPYYVTTQYEFFLEAFTRILAGGSPRNGQTIDWCSTPVNKRVASSCGIDAPRKRSRRANANVRLSRTARCVNNQRIMHP
jgi:hypothetical protein